MWMIDPLLPPIVWIKIPAGRVSMLRLGPADVPAFEISKYPITNAQYAKFIQADGYDEKRWWTDAGWEARFYDEIFDTKAMEWIPSGILWTEPRYWQDPMWNSAEQPVVGVSWYECVAFCAWLSTIFGEKIHLPTEQQWQRAAQGDDERGYPWGDNWDGTRCNNSVSPQCSTQTTPVWYYEGRGDSPFGVVDLVGNANEWCLNTPLTEHTYLEGVEPRVLRGNSWNGSDHVWFMAKYHFYNGPRMRSNGLGFRCVRSMK
jgi:formylglycine-generating enzyme required for sulfatase activity